MTDAAEPGSTMGRLSFRLPRDSGNDLEPYDGPLGVGGDDRDGVLYIPDTAKKKAPLLLFFHGATGTGRRELRAIVAAADRFGVVVLAPDARSTHSWDIIANGGFGPDVEFIDKALASVVDRCAVDTSRIAIGGISDGASYALSLGLSNGDIFEAVIAFSPGFVVPLAPTGKPRLFFSHGTSDPILPIDVTSRPITQGLHDAGYDVTYLEFDGGHTVPPPISDRGLSWWVEGPKAP